MDVHLDLRNQEFLLQNLSNFDILFVQEPLSHYIHLIRKHPPNYSDHKHIRITLDYLPQTLSGLVRYTSSSSGE